MRKGKDIVGLGSRLVARRSVGTARAKDRRAGFTLIELMTVISIIGLLSTVGTVSYDSARRYSRDVKRLNDMNAVQTALELYYEGHLSYPWDGAAGNAGLVLGEGQALTLSDAGFSATPQGRLYLQAPANQGPGGIPYILRSVNVDGTDCDKPPCAGFEIVFAVEGAIGGLDAGVHVLTAGGVSKEASAPAGTLPQVSGSFATIALGTASRAVYFFKDTTTDFLNNPTVQVSAQAVVAPVATAGLVAAVMTAAPVTQLPRLFAFFFSQPFLWFVRGRRRAYGVVYDAFVKLPLDLAIVRLRDSRTGAIVRSAVTDDAGRFSFIVDRGDYRLEVTKPGFVFPTAALKGERTDGEFVDLYHGERIEVTQDGTTIVPTVPLDPAGEDAPDSLVLRRALGKRLRHAVALSGPALAAFSLLAARTPAMGALLLAHLAIYLVFRKISVPSRPKEWGIVYDEESRDPVGQSVLRMFALPYHKLVSTAVTDGRGRYNFLVGPASFYVTVSKPGYAKTETEPVDLRESRGSTVIATDLPLRRAAEHEA